MPVLVERIDPIAVNCLIWAGAVSRAEALGFPARIDVARPDFGCRWISYFCADADLSDLDAACLLELRERLRPVVAGLAAKGAFRMMLVSNHRYNDPMLSAWRTMTATDADYASEPVIVHDLPTAARTLGLTPAEAEHAGVWIEGCLERV
ncbi:MAG: hypothetical protein Q8M88_09525 [Phenylobacterium sp.]|uniref:hypothetical protein n=1 Tax=Phenylobacterium sp. TaxID=1871053 RepID=UPI0027348E3E|nr:hypothetical protein [Phenylobacterium sp.]MDP3174659.1 hypothetical protein [Phenylobacterium sp.]